MFLCVAIQMKTANQKGQTFYSVFDSLILFIMKMKERIERKQTRGRPKKGIKTISILPFLKTYSQNCAVFSTICLMYVNEIFSFLKSKSPSDLIHCGFLIYESVIKEYFFQNFQKYLEEREYFKLPQAEKAKQFIYSLQGLAPKIVLKQLIELACSIIEKNGFNLDQKTIFKAIFQEQEKNEKYFHLKFKSEFIKHFKLSSIQKNLSRIQSKVQDLWPIFLQIYVNVILNVLRGNLSSQYYSIIFENQAQLKEQLTLKLIMEIVKEKKHAQIMKGKDDRSKCFSKESQKEIQIIPLPEGKRLRQHSQVELREEPEKIRKNSKELEVKYKINKETLSEQE